MAELMAQNIPAELKELIQWVGWKFEVRDGKPTKIPIRPKTGEFAKSDDSTTWGGFGAAEQAVRDYGLDGVGFMFSEADPFCGIDLDSCRNPETGQIEQWASNYIARFGSYTEITPSCKGFHIIIKGTLPPEGNRKGKIEVYDRKRFFTFTGHSLNGNGIESRQTELEAFHKEVFGAKQNQGGQTQPIIRDALPSNDEELLRLARNADDGGKFSTLWAGDWKGAGYPSQSEADQGLCNKLAFWFGRDRERMNRVFRGSGLYRKKWDRADYSGKTLDNAIEACREVYRSPKPKPKPGNGECRKTEWLEPEFEGQSTSGSKAGQCSEFPFDALSGVALQFAELYSAYTEPPLQFYYFAFLTCLGSILADKATLESQIEPQPRTYTLLLGESADDRKSTAIDQTIKFFRAFSYEKVLNVCHGIGSAEGLQERLNECKGPDGIAKLLLVFDEFKSFVSKCKIEGSVLLPCNTTLFESNRYESRTKNSNIRLENAYLSLLAASTVQTFQNVWSSQFTDIGFNNRLWLVTGTGERRFSIPRKIPEHDLSRVKRKLADILRLFVDRVEMRVEPAGFAMFDKWYLGLESSIHAKRIDTYALRLMPLLAANEGKTEVDESTVSRVIKLCDWQLQTRKLHDPIDADSCIAKMEEKIRRNIRAKGPLPEWRLKQATGANRDGLFVFGNALKNLQKAREIQWDKSTRCYFGASNEKT